MWSDRGVSVVTTTGGDFLHGLGAEDNEELELIATGGGTGPDVRSSTWFHQVSMRDCLRRCAVSGAVEIMSSRVSSIDCVARSGAVSSWTCGSRALSCDGSSARPWGKEAGAAARGVGR